MLFSVCVVNVSSASLQELLVLEMTRLCMTGVLVLVFLCQCLGLCVRLLVLHGLRAIIHFQVHAQTKGVGFLFTKLRKGIEMLCIVCKNYHGLNKKGIMS